MLLLSEIDNHKVGNCKFENILNGIMNSENEGGSFPITFQDCAFSMLDFQYLDMRNEIS